MERETPRPTSERRRRPGPARTRTAPGREPRRLDPGDSAVQRLDRLAGVGLLAAEVAHEARNALTAVKTYLQLLPGREHDRELHEGLGAVAAEEVARLERLLALLLDQASPGRAPTPALVGTSEIGAALEAVVRLVARRAAGARVHIASDVSADLPRAAIAPDALRQVLLNLVLNAIDATREGGDVRLSARRVGPAVELVVEDRGPGIPPEQRDRVFEPFVSTRREGPGGLGLAIARRLVEDAGGLVTIADRPGGGTRLRVRLPST